jgi:hypothetical protein
MPPYDAFNTRSANGALLPESANGGQIDHLTTVWFIAF